MSKLPDYRDNPVAYEIEELSRPDEMLMIRRNIELAAEFLDGREKAWVLDLCCGTGLSMGELPRHARVCQCVGVDNCLPYLRYFAAKWQKSPIAPVLLYGDAVTAPIFPERWDAIILASAYHHIEHDRKVIFLHRVRDLLKPGGKAFMAENVLPHYRDNDCESYASSVRSFYREVMDTARRDNPTFSSYAEQLIQRIIEYGTDGEYEYKVELSVLLGHLQAAGLKIDRQERVWPQSGSRLGDNAGNFVFVLSASP